MKVLMQPHPDRIKKATSGIAQAVLAYGRHLPAFGVELVSADAETYDLKAVHAGMTGADCDVCMCHGLHWTSDYPCQEWQYNVNAKVIAAIRHAKAVTVPSPWVAETFQRDMHFSPHVVPHGIDWDAWQHEKECGGYVLYNKNRQGDVCDSSPVSALAQSFTDTKFVTTFGYDGDPGNVLATGVLPHGEMKSLIQSAGVYLATTKETFGIGILEAMASGIPVLGYAHGGILDLIEHGVSGYLAVPNNAEDLAQGLAYCQKHRRVLGANAREQAKAWTWEQACKILASVYELALTEKPPTVAVVIPSYNYSSVVGRAIRSAIAQDYDQLVDIIVVDDGSDDGDATEQVVKALSENDNRVQYIRQDNAGVAIARNRGIAASDSKYVVCLDADDAIEPEYVSTLVPALEADRSLGIAYSRTKTHWPERNRYWQGGKPPDFDQQLHGINQVPTCCLFRREAWERLGGYRQRYAPEGAGAEDAEFWLRIGAAGYGIKLASQKLLFLYTFGGGTTTGDSKYREVDWTYWHPWTNDGLHPFASIATPAMRSHPVRAYDEPGISVVIPVGPGHEKFLVDALDSLEAQTFRKWEAIVVNDTGHPISLDVRKAYPFVKWFSTEGAEGAGYARNLGALFARALLLYFLDADDWLYPHALSLLLQEFQERGGDVAVYSDFTELSRPGPERRKQLQNQNKIIREGSDGLVLSYGESAEFNCQDAQKQPNLENPYNWCGVTTLLPKSWHEEIGGFDEGMPSWEDWDYAIRLAKAGKCFVRVQEPLWVYRLYATTGRRELGRQKSESLVQYMQHKHSEEKTMPCPGCGQRSSQRSSIVRDRPIHQSVRTSGRAARPPMRQKGQSQDEDFILCEYIIQKRGSHPVVGAAVFQEREYPNMVKAVGGGWAFSYGFRSQGEQFYVHAKDIKAAPHWFSPLNVLVGGVPGMARGRAKPPPVPEPLPAATEYLKGLPVEEYLQGLPEIVPGPEPEPLLQTRRGFDFSALPGVTPAILAQLEEDGIDSPEALLELGETGLEKYKGVGPARAEKILAAAQSKMEISEADLLREIEELLQ